MSGKAKEAPVRVGGRLRHVRVDNNALCVVEEQTGVNLLEGGKTTLRVLRALCYGALRSGARVMGEPVDFTIEDVGTWMEEEPKMLEVVKDLALNAAPEATDPPVVQGEKRRRSGRS